MLTLNVIAYIAIFLFIGIVYLIEKRDWTCTNSYDVTKECIKGDGMAYRGSKPSSSDSTATLFDKILLASGAENASIKWRRALLLSFSVIIVCYLLVITPGRLPVWTQFVTCVLIGAGLLYFSFNYYSYHRFRVPEQYIQESIQVLRSRFDVKPQ